MDRTSTYVVFVSSSAMIVLLFSGFSVCWYRYDLAVVVTMSKSLLESLPMTKACSDIVRRNIIAHVACMYCICLLFPIEHGLVRMV
jgi:hypothetical protein